MSTPSTQASLVYEQKAILGECPVWDERQKSLFWVDILSGFIFQFDPVQKTNQIFNMGEPVGSFALREDEGVVVALQSGFAFYSFQSNRILRIKNPEARLANRRFNDGKCDPAGRFWSGTLSYDVEEGVGKLYTLDAGLEVNLKLQDLTIPNGMAWDKNKEVFYFIDSPDRTIYVFDYDEKTGDIRNRSVLFEFGNTDYLPDGMTIDSEGYLWIALYNGYRVIRIDPESGETVYEVQLPVPQVTSCTFGGPDLNELYITTAREHMTEKEIAEVPLSGSLFKAELPFRGKPTTRFKG